MIRIANVTLPPGFTPEDVERHLRRERIPAEADWELRRLSLDARKKQNIHYLASVDASWPGEAAFLKKNRNHEISRAADPAYQCPESGPVPLTHRPVIVGAGPAGLFAGRLLAEAGYAPLILERGAAVEERAADVEQFWRDGVLKPDSNVQFGEGGAGTFSDGKLNTQVKDREGRIRQVLRWFVEAGADPSILYWNKPHIGTDVLRQVVRNLRETFLSLGGEICFHSQLTAFRTAESTDGTRYVTGVEYRDGDGSLHILDTEAVILAVGHSARDTFKMLHDAGIPLQTKPFAVGVRVEHPQEMIQNAQYGTEYPAGLPVADYKLTARTAAGRGVYSFCMCPGGQVVNASTEPERIAVNGMSVSARDGRNANAALVVTVTPADFGSEDVLAGMTFQRRLEHLAWESGQGQIPVQLLGDFRENVSSRILGDVEPDICGSYRLGNLRAALPGAIGDSIAETLPAFGRKIAGFDRKDAVFSGVESRTSSPVRILRDEHFESELSGLFPCGEGAGYAGGITSAAVDGIKVAEEIIRRYQRWT
ncbi:MAG: FAD-dependent monooxygenase [Lachnospiraceae bacterium]|nr:FAD-dependent monooxygenase [Lachnospiraceae bacterium]